MSQVRGYVSGDTGETRDAGPAPHRGRDRSIDAEVGILYETERS